MAATSTSDATSVTSNEGPVLSLISKRIRALRKKQNRITQMEESVAQGKSLNKEQQEVLRSKPGILALIDELEKLRSPLSIAVTEEHSLAIQRHNQKNQEPQQESESAESAEDEQQQQQPPSEPAQSEDEPQHQPVAVTKEEEEELEDLLNLLYFGSLFDVIPQSDFTSTLLTRSHERQCCLTYDCVTDDATDPLGEKDLDLIAAMKGMLISRPVDSSLSHKNALQTCIQRAKLWLAKSDQLIDQRSDITYAGLREKLTRIISSDYYTTSPEMKGPADMAVFGSFQGPLQGSMIPVPTKVEAPVTQYQETEGKAAASLQEYETNGSHSAAVEEYQKGELDRDHAAPEEFSNQPTEEQQQHESQNMEEYNHNSRGRDVELRDDEQQQYIPRRSYQQGRGRSGGRRGGGYPNGRGGGGRGGSSRGGGYQNGGRGGQYYDQGQGQGQGRSYYRGRGGRGGGNNYYQGRGGGYADAGVASS